MNKEWLPATFNEKKQPKIRNGKLNPKHKAEEPLTVDLTTTLS